MIRALCLATVLTAGAGLAGSPAECAAQAGPGRQGMILSAAMEEARGGPFHVATGAAVRHGVSVTLHRTGRAFRPAGCPLAAMRVPTEQAPRRAGSFGPRGGRSGPCEIRPAIHRHQPEGREGSVDAPTIALTFLSAAVSHGGGLLLFYKCWIDEYRDRFGAGCYLGPLVPLPVVAGAVALGGVGLARALGTSAIGWLGGGAAFAAAALITEERSGDPDLILAAAASSLVHAGTVTLFNMN